MRGVKVDPVRFGLVDVFWAGERVGGAWEDGVLSPSCGWTLLPLFLFLPLPSSPPLCPPLAQGGWWGSDFPCLGRIGREGRGVFVEWLGELGQTACSQDDSHQTLNCSFLGKVFF